VANVRPWAPLLTSLKGHTSFRGHHLAPYAGPDIAGSISEGLSEVGTAQTR